MRFRETYDHGRGGPHRLPKEELLRTLGFHLDHDTFVEVFDDVDSDDDGAITLEEFITCVGMLKKSVLEVRELEQSFTRFRMQGRAANAKAGEGASEADDDDEHKIYAADLCNALGVTEEIAEEMIYIADLQDNQSITFTEFRQVVVNWD